MTLLLGVNLLSQALNWTSLGRASLSKDLAALQVGSDPEALIKKMGYLASWLLLVTLVAASCISNLILDAHWQRRPPSCFEAPRSKVRAL
jgi:hypothetical protein